MQNQLRLGPVPPRSPLCLFSLSLSPFPFHCCHRKRSRRPVLRAPRSKRSFNSAAFLYPLGNHRVLDHAVFLSLAARRSLSRLRLVFPHGDGGPQRGCPRGLFFAASGVNVRGKLARIPVVNWWPGMGSAAFRELIDTVKTLLSYYPRSKRLTIEKSEQKKKEGSISRRIAKTETSKRLLVSCVFDASIVDALIKKHPALRRTILL